MIHPRVSLHQVAFMAEGTTAFADAARGIGVTNLTLVTPLLMAPGGMDEARAALTAGDLRVTTVNHPFAIHPDLDRDEGQAAAGLLDAIGIAAELGADNIYVLTGGRGGLDWEQAAARFTALIAPCRPVAQASGMRLLVENASAFNADIHIAHTLADTIRLVEQSDVGLCLDLQPCWAEAGLHDLIRRAGPNIGLVQVSDYVLGDRTAPCRAVPGDGVVPLERLIGHILETGYAGLFDLELVGPRIAAEGARSASLRAAERVSDMLTRAGA